MQDVFTNQLAAEIRQHQQAKTGQGPANGFVPAPAKAIASPQQHAENDPGQAGQQCFVHQMLGEQVLDEQPAGNQRQRQQRPAGPEETEQQAFHGLQRREVLDQPGGVLVLELVVLNQQQQGLEHRDGEHAIGQNRKQDVGEDARLLIDDLYRAGGGKMRQQHGQGPKREQQDQQVLHRNPRAGQQGQCDDRHGYQAGGTEEVQGQAGRGQQVGEQADAVGQYGEHAEHDQQAFVDLGAGRQASALVNGRSGVQAGGGESS
ncbi:hypothetical protein D3C84_739280 [compost metagenome]